MPRDNDRDWELVEKARAGDHEAFRGLVEKYQRRVLAVVGGMLHDPEAALDVAQEAFTKVYRSLPEFKGDARFYTWVYRIAVNLAIDHQRREARRPCERSRPSNVALRPRGDSVGRVREEEGGGQHSLLDSIRDEHPESDPFAAASDSELREAVREAIGDLTPDHKAVILLREVEGLSYEEISQVMECSRGTVMSRLHYARKALQAKLAGFV